MKYWDNLEGIQYQPMPFAMFEQLHKSKYNKDGQRLGQRFVNMFLRHDPISIPNLFYEPDANVARSLIRQVLEAEGYIQGYLPPTSEEIVKFREQQTESH